MAGRGPPAMPSSLASVSSLWAAGEPLRGRFVSALIAALHVCALGLLLWTEIGFVPNLAFRLPWGLLNFFRPAFLPRPAVSAALSLALIVVLILLSRLKYEIVWMTANFLDVMIINADTVSFLLAVKPELYQKALITVCLVLPALALIWWVDPFRIRRRTAAAGLFACTAALLGLSL